MNHSEEQDITKVFLEHSDMTSIITESHVNTIERYLSSVYYPREKVPSLSDLRVKHYFRSPDPKLKMLIISYDGLINYVKRSALPSWLAM